MYVLINDNDYMLIDSGNGLTFKQNINALEKISKLEASSNFKIENIKKIVQTHCHIDHIMGLYKFIKQIKPRPQIIASKVEAEYIERGDKKAIIPIVGELIGPMVSKLSDFLTGAEIVPVEVDVKLQENDLFSFGEFEFKIFHTPGHSPGSMCLYEEKYKILFTGDTVFTNGSFGRVDFPLGNKNDLINSLKKLSELEVEMLLPGHMNPILRDGSKHIQLAYRVASTYL